MNFTTNKDGSVTASFDPGEIIARRSVTKGLREISIRARLVFSDEAVEACEGNPEIQRAVGAAIFAAAASAQDEPLLMPISVQDFGNCNDRLIVIQLTPEDFEEHVHEYARQLEDTFFDARVIITKQQVTGTSFSDLLGPCPVCDTYLAIGPTLQLVPAAKPQE